LEGEAVVLVDAQKRDHLGMIPPPPLCLADAQRWSPSLEFIPKIQA
jgi:hypothetical protein